jgi:hypothetical protein
MGGPLTRDAIASWNLRGVLVRPGFHRCDAALSGLLRALERLLRQRRHGAVIDPLVACAMGTQVDVIRTT